MAVWRVLFNSPIWRKTLPGKPIDRGEGPNRKDIGVESMENPEMPITGRVPRPQFPGRLVA